MKESKSILITLDYELFLGAKSGDYTHCILENTQKLIRLFERQAIRNAIFFVDCAYMAKLKSNSKVAACAIAYQQICDQLRELLNSGHYIFPHIHPHWLDAKWGEQSQNWELNNLSRYRLQSLDDDTLEDIIDQSVEFLRTEIGVQGDLGYRAGGWCIQPFDSLAKSFKKNHIKYDFSVVPGRYNSAEDQYYDFRNAPKKDFYRFSTEPATEDPTGDFVEVPISSLAFSKATKRNDLVRRLYFKLIDNPYSRGMGARFSSGGTTNHESMMVSIEDFFFPLQPELKKMLKQETTLQFIGHPKLFTSTNLRNFERFIIHARSNYRVNFDFLSILNPS